MARFADWFTNGGYSRALEERDKLAEEGLGASGYTAAQTRAMRMARDLARGRQAMKQGESMSANTPLGQRIAEAAQAQQYEPIDAYNMYHEMDKAGVRAGENRIAQQQANAMNAQAKVGQTLESGANALKSGLIAAALAEKKPPVMGEQIDASQAPEVVKQSMKANAGKLPSNIKY